MIINFIHWNVNPEIISFGEFGIRWYGLFFVLSFFIGFYILKGIFEKEGIQVELLDKLTMYMLFATIIGARLGHCLFYQPDIYLKNPIEILKVWHGGLASHGAAIAIVLAIYLFARKYKEVSFLWIIDRVVIVVALAGFFIRLGNLMNSEIIGKPSTVSWAFIFLRLPLDQQQPRHPTQIYESFSYLLLFVFLIWYYYKRGGGLIQGKIFSIFLIVLFSIRFIIEFFKDVQVDFESKMPLNMGQLLSIPFIIIGIVLLIWVNNKGNKAPPLESGSMNTD